MGENVTMFGDVADQFDALVAYDEKGLDTWVEDSGYSLKSMVLASGLKAVMTFSKGFVDVGRLGNGVLIEGGAKGFAKDTLRALNLIGGAGAAVGRGAKLLRFVQAGNTCVPVAQANAIRLAGQRFFITIDELAKQSGINLQAIAIAGRQSDTYTRLIAAMQAMKIPVKTLAQGAQLAANDVIALIRANGGGVVTFSIRTAQGLQAHRLFATFSRMGGLVIRDPNYAFKIYRSLADLEKVWGAGAVISESPVLFIPNSLITTAASATETLGGLAGIAMQVVPVVQVLAGDPETAVQALTVREELSRSIVRPEGTSTTVMTQSLKVKGKVHTVVTGDWLSKLAKHYYGNMHKWPVIYAANRKTIGGDPNVIRPGQRLFIPDLPTAHLIAANDLPSVPPATAFA